MDDYVDGIMARDEYMEYTDGPDLHRRSSRRSYVIKYYTLKYDSVIHETEKANICAFTFKDHNDNQFWFDKILSKQYCLFYPDKKEVRIPAWLFSKLCISEYITCVIERPIYSTPS